MIGLMLRCLNPVARLAGPRMSCQSSSLSDARGPPALLLVRAIPFAWGSLPTTQPLSTTVSFHSTATLRCAQLSAVSPVCPFLHVHVCLVQAMIPRGRGRGKTDEMCVSVCSIEELFKLGRMQEQAELAVKGAQAVPPAYMDRYFGQQLRRLQAKEDEISSRAQDLVTKEKNLRAGKVSEDDAEYKKQAEELKRREEELRSREEKLEADAAARVAILEVLDPLDLSPLHPHARALKE